MEFMESDTIELKSELIPDICREVIAFANSHGGTIYIGVQDDGSVIGIDNADETLLRLNNMVRDSIKPDVTMFVRYAVQQIEGKAVLSVAVQKGTDRPYYLASKGLKPSGVYVRNGSSTDPATDTAIRRMIKETDGDVFEDMRALNQQLSFHSATEQFKKCGVDFDELKMQTLGLMTSDKMYTNLGLLLSDQGPSVVKAATFAGKDKETFQDRREFSGSLFRQMEDLYAYLDMRNQNRATFSGLYRTDARDYPEEALREALMNAIVHRDYSFSASTLVSIYDDRIEFVSIGGLAGGLEIDDIMLGMSVCRNPKLAAVFYRLKLIEAYGTGIPKMMKAYQGSGCQPQLMVTSNAFKIVLLNRNVQKEPASDSLSPEERVIAAMREHGSMTRTEVQELLQVSQATANRLLKRMIAQGGVRQEGSGRGTKYSMKH